MKKRLTSLLRISAFSLLVILMMTNVPLSAQLSSCCSGNILQNRDFEDGLRVGNGGFTGCTSSSGSYVTDWCGIGTPQYVFPSTLNSWAVTLWGIGDTFLSGEALYQQVSFIAGNTYQISFRGYFSDQVPTGPDSVIFRFRAYVNVPNGLNDPSGTTIGEFSVKNNSHSPGAYVLPKWYPQLNYNYLMISVHNGSLVDHGDYVSWGTIDEVCVSDSALATGVGINGNDEEAFGITIYPNPSKSILNIRHSLQLGGIVESQIVDQMGKMMEVISEPRSSNEESIDISFLPTGIYYLRIRFENSDITIVKKFSHF